MGLRNTSKKSACQRTHKEHLINTIFFLYCILLWRRPYLLHLFVKWPWISLPQSTGMKPSGLNYNPGVIVQHSYTSHPQLEGFCSTRSLHHQIQSCKGHLSPSMYMQRNESNALHPNTQNYNATNLLN